MAEPLPNTNRCAKCGEGFHSAHVCAAELARAMNERSDHCAGSDDPLYEQAVKLMLEKPGIACISRIQRRLAIGWDRASRLMDAMIERGVIARTYSLSSGVEYTVLTDSR